MMETGGVGKEKEVFEETYLANMSVGHAMVAKRYGVKHLQPPVHLEYPQCGISLFFASETNLSGTSLRSEQVSRLRMKTVVDLRVEGER